MNEKTGAKKEIKERKENVGEKRETGPILSNKFAEKFPAILERGTYRPQMKQKKNNNEQLPVDYPIDRWMAAVNIHR